MSFGSISPVNAARKLPKLVPTIPSFFASISGRDSSHAVVAIPDAHLRSAKLVRTTELIAPETTPEDKAAVEREVQDAVDLRRYVRYRCDRRLVAERGRS